MNGGTRSRPHRHVRPGTSRCCPRWTAAPRAPALSKAGDPSPRSAGGWSARSRDRSDAAHRSRSADGPSHPAGSSNRAPVAPATKTLIIQRLDRRPPTPKRHGSNPVFDTSQRPNGNPGARVPILRVSTDGETRPSRPRHVSGASRGCRLRRRPFVVQATDPFRRRRRSKCPSLMIHRPLALPSRTQRRGAITTSTRPARASRPTSM